MDIADALLTFEGRLDTFLRAHPQTKKRASNTTYKSSKGLKWPHKSPSPDSLAKAGFFFNPGTDNPDNVTCFLCQKSLDGWEEDDDPLSEHKKHSADCGWAIVRSIELSHDEEKVAGEDPLCEQMIDARKSTFAGKWPHEKKKGWVCKTDKLVEAGLYYSPTAESDDFVTCTYCSLALDGWEPKDSPIDEHLGRAPDCPFFMLINREQSVKTKTKTKKGRVSKASQAAKQLRSSDVDSLGDVAAEGDSILTTVTSISTASAGGKKMSRGKKTATGKGRKARGKKEDQVESSIIEPEDDDFEVKVKNPRAKATRGTRGKKRTSDEMEDSLACPDSQEAVMDTSVLAPPAKRRTTRSRTSVAQESNVPVPSQNLDADVPEDAIVPQKPKAKASRGKKRATNEIDQGNAIDLNGDEGVSESTIVAPLSKKKRATRTRNSVAQESSTIMPAQDSDTDMSSLETNAPQIIAPKARGKSGRKTRTSSAKSAARNASTASKASLRMEIPADDEIDCALEADLARPLTDEEEDVPLVEEQPKGRRLTRSKAGCESKTASVAPVRKVTRTGKAVNEDIVMTEVGLEQVNDHDVTPEPSNLQSAIPPKGKAIGKGRQPRKASAKQRAAASKSKAVTEEEPTQLEEPSLPEESVTLPTKGNKSKKQAPKARPTTPPVKAPQLAKQLTPSLSPQSSEAENRPPSSRPMDASSKAQAVRILLAASTPTTSPSKRNVGGLQSTFPWSAIDLEAVFLKSPSGAEDKENDGPDRIGILDDAIEGLKGQLTSPEKKMTVEQWVKFNAQLGEERLRNECEKLVSVFEREGGRAMRVLEGIETLNE